MGNYSTQKKTSSYLPRSLISRSRASGYQAVCVSQLDRRNSYQREGIIMQSEGEGSKPASLALLGCASPIWWLAIAAGRRAVVDPNRYCNSMSTAKMAQKTAANSRL